MPQHIDDEDLLKRADLVAELHRRITAASVQILDTTGLLPIAVTCHPSVVGAETLSGVTVILDPRQPRETIEVR